jgi:predicted nucleic acid-binding protein
LTPVLLDTGIIVAALDRRERRHAVSLRAMEEMDRPIYTCEAVIMESCHLLRKLPGAAESVLANLSRGHFQIAFQLQPVVSEVQALMHKYRDTPADFADACLIQMADKLNTGDILTLDSDFRHYRWRKTRHFNLLIRPE